MLIILIVFVCLFRWFVECICFYFSIIIFRFGLGCVSERLIKMEYLFDVLHCLWLARMLLVSLFFWDENDDEIRRKNRKKVCRLTQHISYDFFFLPKGIFLFCDKLFINTWFIVGSDLWPAGCDLWPAVIFGRLLNERIN